MNFQFHYSGPMNDEFGMVFGVFYGIALLISVLAGVVVYVLRGFGLYTIAKRRGLNNPWLVWIPVAGSWIVGSISDQYRYLVKEEVRNKRKLLLSFCVANAALRTVAVVLSLVTVGKLIAAGGRMSDGQIASLLMGPAVSILIISSVLGVMALVEYVLRQMCMYDLYRSCDPGNAVAYLVLGILFSVLEPIFLIVLRKRDDGLPPRRDIPNHIETE